MLDYTSVETIRMSDLLRDMICIGEFMGERPNIPFVNGISVDTFKEDDADPFFVELPIAEVNVKSGNDRYYDEAFVQAIERQVHEKRPIGLMGHISDEERSTANPIPAGYWVGAARIGNQVWGKAYIPPGAVREYFKTAKKVGLRVGTSVYGLANQVWDKALKAYRVTELNLESIDFGPADRIGVKTLSAVPVVTSEMNGRKDKTMPNEQPIDRATVIRELTADDAVILPSVVRDAVLAGSKADKTVTTLTELVGGDDVVALVNAIIKERDDLRADVVTAEITSQVAERVAVESVRGIVAELVSASKPVDKNGVNKALDDVLARETVKELMTNSTVDASGPSQKRPSEPTTASKGNSMLTPESQARLTGK